MGLILTVVYLLYMLGSPAVWLPFLAQASVQVYVSFLAVVATAPRLLSGSVIRHTPQIAVFCGFFTVVVASPLLQRWAGGVILAFREMVPFLLVLLLVRVNCDTVARRRVLVTALVLLMTTLVLAGTFHYYTHMDDPENKFVFRQGAGDDDEGGDASAMQWVYRLKAQGILDDPNDFAQALLVTIALSTMLWGHSLAANLLLVLVPGSVLMFGIYLTHSRGALVALVVMAMVALRRRLKILGTAVAGLIIGCGLIYIRFTGARQISVSSGVDRLDLWSEGLYLFKHSYGLGIGLHNFADNVGKTAHNSFLLVATETGLAGLALFLAIFVICFTQLVRIVKPVDGSAQDAVLAHEARSLEAALAAYLASSWFLSRAYGPVPYLLVGLVATVAFQAAERAPDTPLLPRWPVLVRNTLILTPACLGAIYAMVRLRGL